MKRFLSCFLSVCMVMSIGIFNVEAATTTNSYICDIDFNSASGSRTTSAGSFSGLGRMILYGVADNTTSIETEGDNRYVKFAYTGSDTGAKGVGAFTLNEDEVLDGNYSISFDYNNISALSSFDILIYFCENQQYGYVPLAINPDGSVTFVDTKFTNTGITQGEWHTIIMNCNTDDQIATLMVDGKKVAEKAWTAGGIMYKTAYNAQKAVVNFRTTRAIAGSEKSVIYFDNLKMYNTSVATDYALNSTILSENFNSRTNSDSYIDMTGSGFYGINKVTAGNEVMSIYADSIKGSNVLRYLGGTTDFTWYSNSDISLGDAKYINFEASFKLGSTTDLFKWIFKNSAGDFFTPFDIENGVVKAFDKSTGVKFEADK